MNGDTAMDLEIAATYGECSVCFEHLCNNGALVMIDRHQRAERLAPDEPPPRRTCRHFVCAECAPMLVPKICPVCRRQFESTSDVPDPLTDPARWFQVVDFDQNGHIDKPELVDALKGMFPVEPRALEELIEANWRSWDTDHNGTIDIHEFRNHLAPFLERTLGNLRRRLLISEGLPDLRSQPAEWFRTWDEDASGSLERPEIVRALIKTIPGLTGRDEEWLSGTFAAIWSIIDPNNDGSITKEEFEMPDGLYHTLLANYFRDRT